MRTPALLLAASCLAPLASHAGDAWSHGLFQGKMVTDTDEMSWTLSCETKSPCKLSVTQIVPRAMEPQFLETKASVPASVSIPNSSLDHARRVLLDHPNALEDPSEGPLLRAIQPQLASGTSFTSCIDIGADTQLLVCAMSGDARGSKSVMLLVGTMKPSCGQQAFCAFYFQPLTRVKGEG